MELVLLNLPGRLSVLRVHGAGDARVPPLQLQNRPPDGLVVAQPARVRGHVPRAVTVLLSSPVAGQRALAHQGSRVDVAGVGIGVGRAELLVGVDVVVAGVIVRMIEARALGNRVRRC